MSQKVPSERRRSVVRVTIRAADCQDTGVGVVIARRPYVVLVPGHLLGLLEEGRSTSVLVDGAPCGGATILPSPALGRDCLSVLRLHGHGKCARGVVPIHVPKSPDNLSVGQSVSTRSPLHEPGMKGRIIDVRDRADGVSIVTDIPISSGDSGSPVLASGRLVAVCQGMMRRFGIDSAVAVPLSQDGLRELRGLRRRFRANLITALGAALLAAIIAFAGFTVYSLNTFTLASIRVSEDGGELIGMNAQKLTLHSSWIRSFDTPIRRTEVYSSQVDGAADRIAVGTQYANGINGAICVLDSAGRTLWSYAVPDGECIYASSTETYDGYLVDVIHVADLDQDGSNEILVAFVHVNHEPCKLVVFDRSGTLLAEYWHPGYIRTIATGLVGGEDAPLVVLSASNNALATEWWNPQTLFAFRKTNISGQGPPYDYLGAATRDDIPHGSELWYLVIDNPDPDRIRAKCREIDIRDFDGDGVNDIQAALTDGRFYRLDENGATVSVKLGDAFQRDFPGLQAPPLIDVWAYIAALRGDAVSADRSLTDLPGERE